MVCVTVFKHRTRKTNKISNKFSSIWKNATDFNHDSVYAVPFGRKVHDEILSSIPETMASYKITKQIKVKGS